MCWTNPPGVIEGISIDLDPLHDSTIIIVVYLNGTNLEIQFITSELAIESIEMN